MTTRKASSRRRSGTASRRLARRQRALAASNDEPPTNPELMVIGDSLAQGVRSLSFRPEFATQCVGARLAASQGWEFRTQTHPQHVLIDVEAEVRELGLFEVVFRKKLLGKICERVNGNLELWMRELVDSTTQKRVLPFDNLAVGGALIEDLGKPASHWRNILMANREFRLTVDALMEGTGLGMISELFKAINFTYVLNPANRPEWESLSALTWLQLRRPRRVLVSIGHNEALWDVGFLAADQEITPDQLVGLDETITALAALDAEWVCWDLLPKVSAVANLDPVSSEFTGSGPGRSDNYFARYQPVLSVSGNFLPGPRLRAIDRSIVATNDAVRARMEAAFESVGHGDRLRFFDDFAFFVAHDFKNQPNSEAPAGRKLRVEFEFRKRSQRIDNRYLAAFFVDDAGAKGHGKFVPKIERVVAGGIQSLDGMHPTGAGYALKAIALSQQPDLNLEPINNPEKLLAQAFEEDTLTKDFPSMVNTLRVALRGLQKVSRAVTAAGGDVAAAVDDEDDACARAWTELMSATITRR